MAKKGVILKKTEKRVYLVNTDTKTGSAHAEQEWVWSLPRNRSEAQGRRMRDNRAKLLQHEEENEGPGDKN